MNPTATRRLIRRMLDSRTLLPETAEELKEYLQDLDRGALDPADDAYVHQLAHRLGLARGGKGKAEAEPADNQEADEQPEDETAEDEQEAFDDPEEEETAAEEAYETEEDSIAATAAASRMPVEDIQAALRRARAALDTLHDPQNGLNLQLGPDDASELLMELRRALDEAEERLDAAG